MGKKKYRHFGPLSEAEIGSNCTAASKRYWKVI
jgi:hypothetical protein